MHGRLNRTRVAVILAGGFIRFFYGALGLFLIMPKILLAPISPTLLLLSCSQARLLRRSFECSIGSQSHLTSVDIVYPKAPQPNWAPL